MYVCLYIYSMSILIHAADFLPFTSSSLNEFFSVPLGRSLALASCTTSITAVPPYPRPTPISTEEALSCRSFNKSPPTNCHLEMPQPNIATCTGDAEKICKDFNATEQDAGAHTGVSISGSSECERDSKKGTEKGQATLTAGVTNPWPGDVQFGSQPMLSVPTSQSQTCAAG